MTTINEMLKERYPERRIEEEDLPRLREGAIERLMYYGLTREQAIAWLDDPDNKL